MSLKRIILTLLAGFSLIFGLICLSTVSITLFWIVSFAGLPLTVLYLFSDYYKIEQT